MLKQKKLQQLSKVLQHQETTLSKLKEVFCLKGQFCQKVLQREKQSLGLIERNNQSKPRKKFSSVHSATSNFIGTQKLLQTSRSKIDILTSRQNDSSVLNSQRVKIPEDPCNFDQSPKRNGTRKIQQVTQNISALEMANLRDKIEMFRLEFEWKMREFEKAEQRYVEKIDTLECQSCEKDQLIVKLSQELKHQVEDKDNISDELLKQRICWCEMYNNLADEMSKLKTDIQGPQKKNKRRLADVR